MNKYLIFTDPLPEGHEKGVCKDIDAKNFNEALIGVINELTEAEKETDPEFDESYIKGFLMTIVLCKPYPRTVKYKVIRFDVPVFDQD